jgi:hypothetical protein
LTLYTIQQEQTIEKQQETIGQQQVAIEQLREENRLVTQLHSRLERLEKKIKVNP